MADPSVLLVSDRGDLHDAFDVALRFAQIGCRIVEDVLAVDDVLAEGEFAAIFLDLIDARPSLEQADLGPVLERFRAAQPDVPVILLGSGHEPVGDWLAAEALGADGYSKLPAPARNVLHAVTASLGLPLEIPRSLEMPGDLAPAEDASTEGSAEGDPSAESVPPSAHPSLASGSAEGSADDDALERVDDDADGFDDDDEVTLAGAAVTAELGRTELSALHKRAVPTDGGDDGDVEGAAEAASMATRVRKLRARGARRWSDEGEEGKTQVDLQPRHLLEQAGDGAAADDEEPDDGEPTSAIGAALDDMVAGVEEDLKAAQDEAAAPLEEASGEHPAMPKPPDDDDVAAAIAEADKGGLKAAKAEVDAILDEAMGALGEDTGGGVPAPPALDDDDDGDDGPVPVPPELDDGDDATPDIDATDEGPAPEGSEVDVHDSWSLPPTQTGEVDPLVEEMLRDAEQSALASVEGEAVSGESPYEGDGMRPIDPDALAEAERRAEEQRKKAEARRKAEEDILSSIESEFEKARTEAAVEAEKAKLEAERIAHEKAEAEEEANRLREAAQQAEENRRQLEDELDAIRARAEDSEAQRRAEAEALAKEREAAEAAAQARAALEEELERQRLSIAEIEALREQDAVERKEALKARETLEIEITKLREAGLEEERRRAERDAELEAEKLAALEAAEREAEQRAALEAELEAARKAAEEAAAEKARLAEEKAQAEAERQAALQAAKEKEERARSEADRLKAELEAEIDEMRAMSVQSEEDRRRALAEAEAREQAAQEEAERMREQMLAELENLKSTSAEADAARRQALEEAEAREKAAHAEAQRIRQALQAELEEMKAVSEETEAARRREIEQAEQRAKKAQETLELTRTHMEDELERIRTEAQAAMERQQQALAEERHRREEEETARQAREAAERQAREEEEAARRAHDEAERKKREAAERKAREALAQKVREEAEAALAARYEKERAEEKVRREQEELLRRAEEEKRREEEERARAERELAQRQQLEALERAQREREDQLRIQLEQRLAEEAAAAQHRLEEERLKREAAEAAQREAVERMRAEAEAERQRAEDERRRREEEEERRRQMLAFKSGRFDASADEVELVRGSEVGSEEWADGEARGALVGGGAFPPGGDLPMDPPPVPRRIVPLEPPEGTLATGELPALLWSAHFLGVTGALDLRNEDGRERRLFLEDGEPVGFVSSLAGDRPELALVRAGLITAARHAELRAGPLMSARRMCAALVEESGLKQHELFTAVRGVFTEQLQAVLEWERVTFKYAEELSHPTDRVRLTRRFDEILADGVRRKFDLERLWNVLGGPATILGPGHGALRLPPLTPQERMSAALLDGTRSLEDVILEVGCEPAVALRSALILLACGSARMLARGIPVTDAEKSKAREADIEIDKERIRDKLRVARDGDYFEFLGVEPEATTYEIQRAAGQIRRRFDPIRFPDPAFAELQGAIVEIREVALEAEEVLSDVELREGYRRRYETRARGVVRHLQEA